MAQAAGDKVMTEASVKGLGSNNAPLTPRQKKSIGMRASIGPVLQFWKNFDLDSKRLMLDTQGTTMKAEKENSMRSRKKLAETTKSFRKLSDSEKISGLGGLLRAYQEEIDNLTRRSKYAENAFFSLYKGLYAAPDPVPSLEAVQDMKISDIEEENKRLKREVNDFEEEFASLKNQDITIRKLEDQLASVHQNMDNMIHEQVEVKTRNVEEQLENKEAEFEQQKIDLERQLETTRQELRDAFTRQDAMQSELFAYKRQSDLAKSSFNAELEVISQDSVLIQTLQLENKQLRKQVDEFLSVSPNTSPSQHASTSSLFSGELDQKESMISALRRELVQSREQIATLKRTFEAQKTELSEKLECVNVAKHELEQELAQRPTIERFNDVLHQLRVLQQLEFNIVDEDEVPSGSATGEQTDPISGAEKILLARVRHLEHAVKQKELLIEQSNNDAHQLLSELEQTRTSLQEQTLLVRNLEESVGALENRKKTVPKASTNASAGILLEAMEEHLQPPRSGASSNGNAQGGDGTVDLKMFEIVRAQRDRFRERIKELQAEQHTQEGLTHSHNATISRLESDNMQLYQKIRYLQNYHTRGGSNGRSMDGRIQPGHHGRGDLEDGNGSGDDVEMRYRGMYEEKLNPFAQFNKLEKQQRYSNLNTVDKILLNSARMVLGHPLMRTIAFSYILVLHFLVVATLYTYMHSCGISNE